MVDPDIVGKRPGPWTWIVGTVIVIAIVWTVFAMLSRKRGSTNDTLPHARIPAASMVAEHGAGAAQRLIATPSQRSRVA